MSQVQKRGPVSPEMNMTPMIDVVFQLIIFFMLVNNIISEQIVEMVPPNLEEPKTTEIGEMNQITVNLAAKVLDGRTGKELTSSQRLSDKNPYAYSSVTLDFVKVGSLREFKPEEMSAVSDFLKLEVEKDPKLEVLLRADGALPYEFVQQVMEAITGAGVRKVHMVSYLLEQEF